MRQELSETSSGWSTAPFYLTLAPLRLIVTVA